MLADLIQPKISLVSTHFILTAAGFLSPETFFEIFCFVSSESEYAFLVVGVLNDKKLFLKISL